MKWIRFLPEFILRVLVRRRLVRRLALEKSRYCPTYLKTYVDHLNASPIALETDAANTQHYEIPAEFYQLSLGKRLKYSSGYYDTETSTLEEAEDAMLALVVTRAQLHDGQDILELGCGWGSFTLYAAKQFPHSRITAVSNSKTQKAFIDQMAQRDGLSNITVITQDINTLVLADTYDRIVSIEMLEHVRNYTQMFEKMAGFLKPDGRCFVHVFGHRLYPYVFDKAHTSSVTSQHFFTGGQMPSRDLFSHFDRDLVIETQWDVNGMHYAKTCRDWNTRNTANQKKITAIFEKKYGSGQGPIHFFHWRLFYILCEELFGFNGGTEWQVFHYRFKRRDG